MTREYVAPKYWEETHEAADDESAVGYPNLARSINRARYDVELHNVARALDAAGVPRPDRVLDAGSGTGIWIDFWRSRGARQIVGVDLTNVAVERLTNRYPEHEFLQRDIGDTNASLPGGMDVVSAMSVLLHITDEARFERALNNVMGCVRDGGSIVLVEPVVVHRWWGKPFDHKANSKARPLATYQRILATGGFTIVELRPATCLLANVIDTRRQITFQVLERYWALLGGSVGRRERLGRVVGAVLRAIDLLATRVVPNGPSAKIIVARRAELAPAQSR
jgi:SAM-dependent methyltransferase